MAALHIFETTLAIVPDVNKKWLSSVIDYLINERQSVLADGKLAGEFSESLYSTVEDVNENVNYKPVSTADVPDQHLVLLTEIFGDFLFSIPSYPKRKPLASIENVNKINTMSSEKPMTAAALDNTGTISPDFDDPDFMPNLYWDEAIQLLTNEFRWFFVTAVKKALKNHNCDYFHTRKFLIELIAEELDTEQVNILTVDPVLPQYPKRLDKLLAKSSRRSHITKDGEKYELLKVARKVMLAPINITHPRLSSDLAKLRSQPVEDQPVTCSCCEIETTVDSLVTCVDGHVYCSDCLIGYVETKVQDGVKLGYLECMLHECSAPFSQNVLMQKLPNDLMEKLDERIAMANVNQADIANLVRCPKCQTPFELEDGIEVLNCVICKHQSCPLCQQPWTTEHKGKRCEELETNDEVKLRRLFEERMTAELVRPCPRCRTPIIKTEGCNKMTCSCKATLCYVCREPFITYEHFCQHPRNPGHPCDQCTKCSLWIDPEVEDSSKIRQIEDQKKKALEYQKDTRIKTKKGTTSDSVDAEALFNAALEKMQIEAPAMVTVTATEELKNAVLSDNVGEIENIVEKNGKQILSNMLNEGGDYALHVAANRGLYVVVSCLIRLGADVSKKNNKGLAAIHMATLNDYPDIAKELLKNRANVNETGENSMTALHYAARNGRYEVAKVLIQHRANLQVREEVFGQTPLHFACHYNRLDVADLLCYYKADLRATDNSGGTPLHRAAASGNSKIVQLLIDYRAFVNELNYMRRTPLHLCCFFGPGNFDTAEILLYNGANPVFKDKTGRSAIDNAVYCSKRNITRLLRKYCSS